MKKIKVQKSEFIENKFAYFGKDMIFHANSKKFQ